MRETVRQRKRDRLQPEIRVGVSGSQVFSLFAARTWNRTWLQLLSFSVVLPLSPACLPAWLPALAVPLSSQTVFGYSLRCLSQQTIANHIAEAAASVPYPMTSLLTPSTHCSVQYQSQFPNNSLPDALSFFFFLSGAICKLPTWGSVSLGIHFPAGPLRPLKI